MISRDNAVLVVVDIQGKLAEIMNEKEQLIRNAKIMITGAKELGLPIIWMEQVPEKLGATNHEVASCLEGNSPINKVSFSCCGNLEFVNKLRELKKEFVIIIGIETHVCVYQTVVDLIRLNYKVILVKDATSSRTIENKNLGVEIIRDAGAKITGTETILFQLLKRADDDCFRTISKLVK
ncbi:MAG: isochorismatase family protein [Melioribacteraceae bacterium]|nr:isochorismatase family protein [Melioribacteraceae bacterium]